MKACVFNGNKLELKEVPKPILTDNQALIKVKAVGICGTDYAIVNGSLPTPIPIILGHEFAGEVLKVGKNLEDKWVGKRVTSEINSNIDFNCYYCERKQYTQCVSRKAIGIDIDGALAEYIAVDSYLLHEIPENITYLEATFIEPLAAAYQTFEMMKLDVDDNTIAIFGLGKLGLLMVQVAKEMGLKVIAIDGSKKKLLLAKKFETDWVLNRLEEKDIVSKIKKLSNGIGADIVVDTSGNPEVISDVISACKTRGKLHIKSTHGIEVPLNITELVVREITLYTSRCGPFQKAIEGLRTGKIQVKDLISHIFPLNEITTAFRNYKKDHDTIKIIIEIQ
jgi:threonine dehydrogenase-like Zn-dependent dehydrogenase